jgi:hypothetical protein
MKKFVFVLILFAFFGFLAFADNNEQEEVGYLVFALNSSSQFVNQQQAAVQLDTIANYLASKNLYPGQIHAYGYTAAAANDIDSEILSRDRAIFVINELQKRGVSKELFSDPVGYGAVDTWGSNISERDKIPNRRVRIVLDSNVIEPESVHVLDFGAAFVNIIDNDVSDTGTTMQESSLSERRFKFPWILLLLLLALIAALLFSKLWRNKKSPKLDAVARPVIVDAPIIAVAPVATGEITVNLDNEIRSRSYELYQQRNGQNEDHVADWHIAVQQICCKYEADGYETYAADGSWWARR